MKVIMPMAGRGSRFLVSNYNRPKPLIEVFGKPMFIHALKSLENVSFNQIIFIALIEHQVSFDLNSIIESEIKIKSELLLISEVTEGQLCTALIAKELINTDEDILIISADTIVESDIGNDIKVKSADCEGIISVANMLGDRWSFAKTNSMGNVIEVTEKLRISDNASTGLYYFSNGKKFVDRAEKMIADKKTTKGEYFIMPLYRDYIDAGENIRLSNASRMWDLGTPESLHEFLVNER